MEDQFNYEKDLAIDKNRLDEEWLKIAQDLWRYGKLLGQAIYDHDRAKQSLDVCKANLDAAIRHKFNTAVPPIKFTEAVVDGQIRTDPTYMDAQERYFQASRAMNLHQQAVYSFQAKKAALENLVKLLQSNYWAEPRAPQAQSAVNSTDTEQMHKAMAEAIPAEMLKKTELMPGPETMPQEMKEATQAPAPKPPLGAATVGSDPGQPPLLNEPSPVAIKRPQPLRRP